MAIDRIGKGGGFRPVPEAPEAGLDKAAQSFTVERGEQASRTEAATRLEGPAAPSPIARLRAGEIDVHQYVDLKVEDATASLKGCPAAELDAIKSVLRDQLRSDPGLADLVRTATGTMPSPPEE